MHGDQDTVRSLLSQKADVNAPQGDGTTALHWAAYRDDLEMAKLLLAAGANVQAATREGGITPLLMACQNGNAAMIDALLKAGADSNAVKTNGTTPLMMAAASGSVDAVKTLLDHGAGVNAKESAHGQTALMFAAALNRAAVVKVLLANGADAKIATNVAQARASSLRSGRQCSRRESSPKDAEKTTRPPQNRTRQPPSRTKLRWPKRAKQPKPPNAPTWTFSLMPWHSNPSSIVSPNQPRAPAT